eukprot:438325-Amphidinium_carterae.2
MFYLQLPKEVANNTGETNPIVLLPQEYRPGLPPVARMLWARCKERRFRPLLNLLTRLKRGMLLGSIKLESFLIATNVSFVCPSKSWKPLLWRVVFFVCRSKSWKPLLWRVVAPPLLYMLLSTCRAAQGASWSKVP